ncbi:MAG: hypothetical protein JOZ10_17800 [Acidobacteria bacterium]|nr:hypothetical protein [Acidobacteriota bacterium]MBV9144601.1 hypothetical protein [Acidobacteriota bacterium]
MDFDLQPTLLGELLELRPLLPEDSDALFAAASDPLIWEQHPESDRYGTANCRFVGEKQAALAKGCPEDRRHIPETGVSPRKRARCDRTLGTS